MGPVTEIDQFPTVTPHDGLTVVDDVQVLMLFSL